MAIEGIIAELDAEINRLEQVKRLLSDGPTHLGTLISKRGAAPKKRILSPEARKRIADAQRKRWAAQKAKK